MDFFFLFMTFSSAGTSLSAVSCKWNALSDVKRVVALYLVERRRYDTLGLDKKNTPTTHHFVVGEGRPCIP